MFISIEQDPGAAVMAVLLLASLYPVLSEP
jgi:hypothetical protein